MQNPARIYLARLGAGLFTTLVAAGLTAAFWPASSHFQFAFFIVGVVISAWTVGFIGGATATLSSTAAIGFLFLPAGLDPFKQIELGARLALFLAFGLAGSWILRDGRRLRKERLSADRRYRAIANEIDQLVWMDAPDGSVCFVNRKWMPYAGLKENPADPLPWSRLVHPDDVSDWIRIRRDGLAAGRRFEGSLRIRRRDGAYRWHLIRVTPFVVNGAVTSWFGTATDVHDIKETEAELRRSTAQFELSLLAGGMGSYRLDLETRTITRDAGLCRILGLPMDDGGRDDAALYDRVHPDDRAGVYEPMARAMASNGDFSHENRIVQPNGAVRWVCGHGRVIVEETGRKILVGVIADITERKKSEDRLARKAAELERSNRDLERFAYVASHDLKEPLRKVSNYLELLEAECGRAVGGIGRRYIAVAVQSVVRMNEMINDLLIYSRAASSSEVGAVDLQSVFGDVRRNLSACINETGACIDAAELPCVRGDHAQMLQLFQHIVSNAVKYRSAAPPVVKVTVRRTGPNWTFTIADNGIGIAQAHQRRIFEIFHRLHPKTRYPGTGIGLAVCKKIVERSGGRIWAESETGRGAAFHFTLPAADPVALNPAEPLTVPRV